MHMTDKRPKGHIVLTEGGGGPGGRGGSIAGVDSTGETSMRAGLGSGGGGFEGLGVGEEACEATGTLEKPFCFSRRSSSWAAAARGSTSPSTLLIALN